VIIKPECSFYLNIYIYYFILFYIRRAILTPTNPKKGLIEKKTRHLCFTLILNAAYMRGVELNLDSAATSTPPPPPTTPLTMRASAPHRHAYHSTLALKAHPPCPSPACARSGAQLQSWCAGAATSESKSSAPIRHSSTRSLTASWLLPRTASIRQSMVDWPRRLPLVNCSISSIFRLSLFSIIFLSLQQKKRSSFLKANNQISP
jgi:hypothetical protein